ncbi:MAG: DNA mismatch repair endonuclease MutL [Thermosynechococcaceae cyanobacterium MS004]|nr:DNA mismatch repair endonuclease MutL [Thermosynechococcaceae cyanobacterium MS004]
MVNLNHSSPNHSSPNHSSLIQPLKAELVYRIAAGEVIDSLGAVVRELIDNALDAGATRLQIAIWPQAGRVQVTDNGCGMTWEDLLQAALPHTTSKLSAFHNLGELGTLGFRGEALHSLAQLGQLEIYSRAESGQTGWCVTYTSQGAIATAQELAIAVGTTVTVTALFKTWPSRQDALANPQQAMQSIQSMIGDYALCHPQISWQVFQAGRDWFSLAPGSPKATLMQLLRKLSPDDLHYSKTSLTPDQNFSLEQFTAGLSSKSAPTIAPTVPFSGTLELLLGLPDRLHRHKPDWIRVAVNGRRVSVNMDAAPDTRGLGPLEQSMLNAFRQTLPRHRYPVCWIHLHIPSAWVDYNRTASKSHIYLHHLEDWRSRIMTQIDQSLHLANSLLQDPFLPGPSLQDLPLHNSLSRTAALFKSAEQRGRYALAPVNLSSDLPSPEANQTPEQSGLHVETLRAIAQLHQTYILAEHPAGLWLVEQHIAHERVLYEQLCKDWQLIPLPSPITLRHLSEPQIESLKQIGLDLEPFGQDLWAIRTVPQLLAQRPDCAEALQELSHCRTLQSALVSTACRSALRNGQTLDLREMQTLLNQWQQTQHPRTCPHGRPIYLALEEQSLSRFFRRHWVIGKSHGLSNDRP